MLVPRALRTGRAVLRVPALFTAGFCAHPMSKLPEHARIALFYVYEWMERGCYAKKSQDYDRTRQIPTRLRRPRG